MDWNELISIKNIYRAWKDFVKNKNNKPDVVEFKMNLEEEILQIQNDLKNETYKHGFYSTFKVYDPKERIIHKAKVSAFPLVIYPRRFLLIFIYMNWICLPNTS